VANAGGFRKAADALGVEQSALSRRVRGLEDEIGVSLFHRNPGGATPTFAGVSFIRGVEHALDLLSDTVTEAREAGQGRLGRLKIGLTPSFLSEALFGLLHRFRGAHPHVQIEMVSGEAGDHLSAVADRRLDIAVLPGGMTVTGLDVSELWRDALHVVLPASHPLARGRTVDLQSLSDDPLLISEGDLGADVLAQTPMPPRYLRTAEAARHLGLSGRTLEKHRCYGTGPLYRKIGGRVVYAVGDLQAWADRGVKSSTPDPGHDRIAPARRPDRDRTQ